MAWDRLPNTTLCMLKDLSPDHSAMLPTSKDHHRCINGSVMCKTWVATALLYSALVRPELEYSVQFHAHTHTRDHNLALESFSE